MLTAFKKLKEDIKNHSEVKESVLGLSENWKSNHYQILSDKINNNLLNNTHLNGNRKYELGTSISAITLKRFFENQFSSTAVNDLRFLKTLDKLCIFIGYKDFNTYLNKNTSSESANATDNSSSFAIFKNLVENCAALEFKLLQDLPNENTESLDQYIFEDAPYKQRIILYHKHLLSKHLSLQPQFSNYEVFDIKLFTEDSELVVIETSEFWNLGFSDDNSKRYHYHVLNLQKYFIRKRNNIWKIWDNYNPNVGELVQI